MTKLPELLLPSRGPNSRPGSAPNTSRSDLESTTSYINQTRWKRGWIETLRNPFRTFQESFSRTKNDFEMKLIQREERMKEDLERFLMEIEEQYTWLAYQLNYINSQRLKRYDFLYNLSKQRIKRLKDEENQYIHENGLNFQYGNIESFRRSHQSSSKHYDIIGHKNSIMSIKLSSNFLYLVSCSEDYTIRIWDLQTYECLKILTGHTRIVNDIDLHPTQFKMYHKDLCIISCSGDCTVRLWNTSETLPIKTIYTHDRAVFRCVFAPNGTQFVTSSADCTVKLWSFPEGICMFVYRGHQSPVTALTFSMNGRFIASGSNYGERKILVWDALQPIFNEPAYYPHMIRWSRAGMIKKFLVRKEFPNPGFWLDQTQRVLANNGNLSEVWAGELTDSDGEESEDEDEKSEEEEDEEGGSTKYGNDNGRDEKKDAITSDDIRETNGLVFDILQGNGQSEPVPATEYSPGGYLIFKIQSFFGPIESAFLSATVKESRFDSFTEDGGKKVGEFDYSHVVPWLPTQVEHDPNGRANHVRVRIPGLGPSRDGHSAMFRQTSDMVNYMHKTYTKQTEDTEEDLNRDANTSLKSRNPLGSSSKNTNNPLHETSDEQRLHTSLEVVWKCPPPGLGTLVLFAKVRLGETKHHQNEEGNNKWVELRCSLKESLTVYSASGQSTINTTAKLAQIKAQFDPLERHNQFVTFLRNRDWKAASTFIERNCALYLQNGLVRRRFRVMNMLIDMFDEASWMVLDTPFEYKDGLTKALIISDYHFLDVTVDPEEDYMEGDVQEGDLQEGDAEVIDSSEKKDLSTVNEENSYNENDDIPQKSVEGEGEVEVNGEGEEVIPSIFKSPLEHVILQRPTTKDLNLPKIYLLEDIESKIFAAKVAYITEQESLRVMKCVVDIHNAIYEIGFANFLPSYTSMLLQYMPAYKKLHELHPRDILMKRYLSLIQSLFDNMNSSFSLNRSRVSVMLEKISKYRVIAWKQEEMANTEGPTIHSGKYGPEIEDFSMPLPVNYPKTAGMARDALADSLSLYQETLVKRHGHVMPTTLEEVYEPSFREKFDFWYDKWTHKAQKEFKRELEEILVREGQYRVLYDNSYLATRRRSYYCLPGLWEHNPNVAMRDPCFVPSDLEYDPAAYAASEAIELAASKQREKLSSTMVVTGTRQLPPVGRKYPNFQCMQDMWNATSQEDRVLYRKQQLTRFQEKKSFRVDVLDNLVPSLPPKKNKSLGSSSLFRRSLSETRLAAARREEKERRKDIAKRRKERLAEYNRLARLRGINYPPGMFFGRRTYYPVLPGLEDFAAEYLSSREMQHAAPELNDSGCSAGLIRRFRIKNYEIAHHGGINDIVFSPSDLRLATAGGDNLIKIWDPRDGTYVKSLNGHTAAVMSVRYSSTEQYLVSAGADRNILIWNLLSSTIQRTLRGHHDVIYSLSVTPDFHLMVSASHDFTIKTWRTTPDRPEKMEIPRVVNNTDTTVMLRWLPPPAFNCDITAYHYQYRVKHTEEWLPLNGRSVAPQLTTYTVKGLVPATNYQFRVCAENRMGRGLWSNPSVMMKTEYGKSLTPERPLAVHCTRTSITIAWFTPDPETFGSASTAFQIQCFGNGRDFNDHPTFNATLEEAATMGTYVLGYIRQVSERHDAMKGALLRSKAFSMHSRQSEEQRKEFDLHFAVANEILLAIWKRSLASTHRYVAVCYEGLVPGRAYSFRVRGENVEGPGDWSDASLSITTLPTLPGIPDRPIRSSATLRSLVFRWDPPHEDGGSAITGYRIHLYPDGKEIDLPRSTTTYHWEGLFPGRSYYLRVQARNNVGLSDLSEPNSEEDSFTATAVPETGSNPLPVDATWNTLILETYVPFHNGAPVVAMEVEFRTIAPFVIGPWQVALPHSIKRTSVMGANLEAFGLTAGQRHLAEFSLLRKSKDVIFLKYVDIDEQQQQMDNEAALHKQGRAARVSVATVDGDVEDTMDSSATAASDVITLRNMKGPGNASSVMNGNGNSLHDSSSVLDQPKPNGSHIRFTIYGLSADTMYETRTRFRNKAGWSEFSPFSHRAKTNHASLPSVCKTPVVLAVGPTYVGLEIYVPPAGGAEIRCFIIEVMNLEDRSISTSRHSYKESEATLVQLDDENELFAVQYRLQGLLSDSSYIFRCRAETTVGEGPSSPWTGEVVTPPPAGSKSRHISVSFAEETPSATQFDTNATVDSQHQQ